MPESFDVFISYKREDQTFAETLRERLIAWGYTVWMDVYNIPAGAYWPDEIDQGLNASKVVIGVLSPRAVASRNVKNEWDWAIVNGKRLLLLMIESCKVPMNYVSINYIDCVKDQAEGLARLQAALTDPASSPLPTDPYRDYLQALYNRINAYLAQKIIKVRPDDPSTPEPISLHSERTRGAVDALFEKRDELDPLFMIGGVKQEMVELDGDFRKAFDYFDGRVLLLGEPGSGKTITLLHFGRDAVVQRIQDPAKPLPVLAIIPTWDAEKQTPLAEWLADSYGAPPDVARLVAEGRALLLLDGLDELGRERKDSKTKEPYDPRQRFMEIIPSNNQIVVTSRAKDYDEIGKKIALKGAVMLQRLTDAQIRDYLSAEVPDLWAALEADEELRDVARIPLLLSFFAFAYRDADAEDRAKLQNLRSSPGELRNAIFERYVRERYEHEARNLSVRGERMPYSFKEITTFLGYITMVKLGDPYRFESLEYNSFSKSDFRQLGIPAGLEDILCHLHMLVFDEGSNNYRFMHWLLINYFALSYCNSILGNFKEFDNLHSDYELSQFMFMYHMASEAAGYIGDSQSVNLLLEALDSSNPDIRADAASALGTLRVNAAVDDLKRLLTDREAKKHFIAVEINSAGKLVRRGLVCDYAAEALERIGTPEALAIVEAWRREQRQK